MEQAVGPKINSQVASGGTLAKLVLFTVSLGVLPLSSYFLSMNYLWDGNATWAAITAIAAANFVLVAYIITSLLEDQAASQRTHPNPTEAKKND